MISTEWHDRKSILISACLILKNHISLSHVDHCIHLLHTLISFQIRKIILNRDSSEYQVIFPLLHFLQMCGDSICLLERLRFCSFQWSHTKKKLPEKLVRNIPGHTGTVPVERALRILSLPGQLIIHPAFTCSTHNLEGYPGHEWNSAAVHSSYAEESGSNTGTPIYGKIKPEIKLCHFR